MNLKAIIPIVFLTAAAALVFALVRQPHRFSSDECAICHLDVKNAPMNISAEITRSCQKCHSALGNKQSHPTDIYPALSVPADMPLTAGMLTCNTCHYVHPEKEKQNGDAPYFLRRPATGVIFCSACHKIDEKRHIVFENVHSGSYNITDRNTRIDRMSLECIICHDRYMVTPANSLGAGSWKHFSKKLNHPIGVSYRDISSRDFRKFRPSGVLGPEIKLFGDKIGCGTCHNVYSKRQFMLVMDNRGSRLCLECHIK